MSSFFELVKFEYKKIFKRKSTIVCLIAIVALIIFITIMNTVGGGYMHSVGSDISKFKAMEMDREVIRSKTGVMDEALVREAIDQYSVMMADENSHVTDEYGKRLKSEAYIKYVLPYENIVNIINSVYEVDTEKLSYSGLGIMNVNRVMPIETLVPDDAKNFYSRINESAKNYINGRQALSDNEKAKHLEMLSQVKSPFDNGYNDGYKGFQMLIPPIALALLIVIAICISPIFSNEYQTKTDQILLSTKHGKNRAIFAKLFTGVTFTAALGLVTMFGFLFTILSFRGFDGANMPIQTVGVFSTYTVTLLQASLISIAITILMALLFAMFTMLISALSRSSFMVVIISFLVLFIPLLINISPNNRLLFQLLNVFPAKATIFENIFSEYLFEILGVVFTPVTFYTIFTIVGSLTIIPFAYRSFKKHQIA